VLLSQTCKQLLSDFQQGIRKKHFGSRLAYMNDLQGLEARVAKYKQSPVDVHSEEFQVL
jgi:hypothetical protein